MKPSRARILRASSGNGGAPLSVQELEAPVARARVLRRAVIRADADARQIIESARLRAEAIETKARSLANDITLQQRAVARADALSLVVAQAVALREKRETLSQTLEERSIELGRLLAERLLGEQLSLTPERVSELARQALSEAAGARRATITANPLDAAQLRNGLCLDDTLLDQLQIEEDPQLENGQLRIETELGVVEADVSGQLERLADQLKKLLKTSRGFE